MTQWDSEFDVVSIGSGGGGLTAALAASQAGASAVVIEKRELLGGSTSMSGGVLWLPNNSLMQRDGVPDSDQLGMEYFESVVGDEAGTASSPARRRAFIEQGRAMVDFLLDQGVRLVRCEGYSDYYSSNPGGSARGRSIEPPPWNGNALGDRADTVQPGMAAGIGLVVKTNELRKVQYYNRSVRNLLLAARVQARTWFAKLRGQRMWTNGTALVGQLVKACLDGGVELWTQAPFEDFIVEDGRVAGVRVVRDGRSQHIRARLAVVIAAGGFAHNADLRQEHGDAQSTTGQWSISNPGDTGDTLAPALKLGARTALLDEAWWLPGPSFKLGRNTLNVARQRPHTILVDSAGRRFVNESNSYVEVGKAIFARNQTTPAVPCWLIFDDTYRRRYSHQGSPVVGRLPRKWLDSGLVKKADTLDSLARTCGIDPDGLLDQVTRWNHHAVDGRDPEFGRGSTAYNDCLGDPGDRRNAAVGPIDRAPFYATEIYPADVGTCGGLLTDEFARVIGDDDRPMPGLYATGNGTATVMGRHYLGAGASIAGTMVFGYVAAVHATSGS